MAVVLAILMLVAASGCTSKTEEPAASLETGQTMHMVTDDLGREVAVPEHPERVLALNSSMMENLFNLGVVPIGKVNEYVIPRPEAESLPDISYENSPNIEIITQLAPDLIFAHARNHGQLLDSLEGTGAAVFYIDPSKGDDPLVGGVALMGEVLNRQAEAAAFLKEVDDRAAELRQKVAESPVKTAIFIQGGSESIMAAQTFCFWGRLLSYLGIENIVPENMTGSKAGFVDFDIETIIQKDPDVVLVLQPGFRSGTGQGKKGNGEGQQAQKGEKKQGGTGAPGSASSMSPEQLLAMYQNDPMWNQLTAVKEGKLIIVPENIAPGKINVMEALEIVANLVAPEDSN